MPAENRSARPPSRSPRADSKASHVGLVHRPYPRSPGRGAPGEATYVEANTSGEFSGASGAAGGRPAVTATVAGDSGTDGGSDGSGTGAAYEPLPKAVACPAVNAPPQQDTPPP